MLARWLLFIFVASVWTHAFATCTFEWEVQVQRIDDFSFEISWVLTKNGQIDARATAQAIGMGVFPQVLIQPFFWDTLRGASTASIDSRWNVNLESTFEPSPGWIARVRIGTISSFTPMLLKTSGKALPATMDICDSQVVLRAPLLELSEAGSRISLGSKQRDVNGRYMEEEVDSDGDEEGRVRFATKSTWDRMQHFGLPGVSWSWFILAWSEEKTAIATWASTNVFEEVKTTPALDLGFIYPFENARSEIDFEWDLDPFFQPTYGEVEEPDPYLDGAISDEDHWFLGPCGKDAAWAPQLFSLGRVLLSSTTWGVAMRSLEDNLLDSPLINYGWTAVAPICSRIIPEQQLDSLSPELSCSSLLLPTTSSLTANFTNETSYDISMFQDLELPTVFRIQSSAAVCHGKSNNMQSEDQEVLTEGTEEDLLGISEIKDLDGRRMAQVVAEYGGAEIIDAISMRTQDPNWVLFLLRVNVTKSPSSYICLTFDNGVWKRVFQFKEQGLPKKDGSFRVYGSAQNSLENGENTTWTPLDLRGIKTTRSISIHLYLYGNVLLLSNSFGTSFWTVEQRLLPGCVFGWTEERREAYAFRNDPIVQMELSLDGWIALLTENRRLWVGKAGSNGVYLMEQDQVNLFEYDEPPGLFFDEASELRVYRLRSIGKQDNLRTLASTRKIPLEKVKATLMSPKVENESQYSCVLDSYLVFAPQSPSQVRELSYVQGFRQEELVRIQESTFFNSLPERIFLDHGDEYSFKVRLYSSKQSLQQAQRKEAVIPRVSGEVSSTLNNLRLGFELSSQTLITLHVERSADMIHNTVDYDITLRDNGLWGRYLAGNASSEEFALLHQNSLPKLAANGSFQVNKVYGLPGENLAITTFTLKGFSDGCESYLHPGSIVTNQSVHTPIQLQIYSGCPPLKRIIFDAEASRANVDHGCTEREEDICLFYHLPFFPAFSVIDLVTGMEETVGGSFGEIFVVGGGLTYDTIEEYPEEERQALTSQVVTFETPDTLRWVCLVKGSPCYRVQPRFPAPPEYYFILELRSNSNSSYCDFSTRFVVRVHNLPITIETILVTNFATIFALVVPLLAVFYNRQQQIKKNLTRVQDVDVTQLQRQYDSSESDESYSSDSDRSETSSEFGDK